jgi:hypothetical protein
MQAWQIIVASAVMASIVAAALFLPGVAQSPGAATALLQTYWPAIAIVWLGAYGVAALGFGTVTAMRELGGAASVPFGQDWLRRYLMRLGVTHYFSAALALLALGLLPVAVATEPFFSLSAPIGASPALTACGVVILVGILGWLVATIAAAFRPPVAAAEPSATPELRLLQEIIELLRARPIEPGLAATDLTEQLRQRDRSTLEAIKELAGAVNRVRNGISELQNGLQHHGPEQAGQEGSAALAGAMAVTGELRAAVATLTATVTKLETIAGELAAPASGGLSPSARGNLPPGSRSQLSTELQELLRDMTTGPAPRDEGSR